MLVLADDIMVVRAEIDVDPESSVAGISSCTVDRGRSARGRSLLFDMAQPYGSIWRLSNAAKIKPLSTISKTEATTGSGRAQMPSVASLRRMVQWAVCPRDSRGGRSKCARL